jgi:hypothetical protein
MYKIVTNGTAQEEITEKIQNSDNLAVRNVLRKFQINEKLLQAHINV